MDLFHDQILLPTILFVLITSFIISSLLKKHKNTHNQKNQVPQCGGACPIVGHLPLLAASKVGPHQVLTAMAQTHGPIFGLRLGVNQAVVIGSSDLARECLLTNDKAVSGRSRTVFGELVCYNNAMFGFGPYGSYWRHMRKVVMLELLSNQRLSKLAHVWKEEVKMFVKDLYGAWASNKSDIFLPALQDKRVVVDLKQRLRDLGMNIILKIICGKKVGFDSVEDLEFHEAIREFMEQAGCLTVGDAVPFLRWLDIGGQEKAMKRTFKKLDNILQRWVDEHKQKRPKDDDDKDFMDIMLSVIDDETTQECNYDADTINKATCLTMIAGGADTTPIVLIWAISLLLNNPHVLKKAQDELTSIVGKDRQVEESDLPRLVYLQAIVKETFRLYPVGPILNREVIQDCTIGGYNIQAGTKVLVNLDKIFHDPETWDDPQVFKPERFLETYRDVNLVRGQNFELIPFGSGRRICAGASFATQVVHLTLASVLHAFEISIPSDNDEGVDMSARFGMTCMKAKPLEVVIKPNLSAKEYV